MTVITKESIQENFEHVSIRGNNDYAEIWIGNNLSIGVELTVDPEVSLIHGRYITDWLLKGIKNIEDLKQFIRLIKG